MKLCAFALLVQGSFDMVFYSGAVSLLFFGSLGFSADRHQPDAACADAAGYGGGYFAVDFFDERPG